MTSKETSTTRHVHVGNNTRKNCSICSVAKMKEDLQSAEKCKGLELSTGMFSCNVNSDLCILHKCTDNREGCHCELQSTEKPLHPKWLSCECKTPDQHARRKNKTELQLTDTKCDSRWETYLIELYHYTEYSVDQIKELSDGVLQTVLDRISKCFECDQSYCEWLQENKGTCCNDTDDIEKFKGCPPCNEDKFADMIDTARDLEKDR